MGSITEFYYALLRALYAVSPSPAWTRAIEAAHPYLPVVIPVALAAGAFLAVKLSVGLMRSNSARSLVIVMTIILLGLAAWSGANLYLDLGLSVEVSGLLFVASLLCAALALGIVTGLYLKRSKSFRYYMTTIGVMGLLTWIAVNQTTGPSSGGLKADLRNRFQSITGREPGNDDKKAFWKSAVGEENPSAAKKDQHCKEK